MLAFGIRLGPRRYAVHFEAFAERIAGEGRAGRDAAVAASVERSARRLEATALRQGLSPGEMARAIVLSYLDDTRHEHLIQMLEGLDHPFAQPLVRRIEIAEVSAAGEQDRPAGVRG